MEAAAAAASERQTSSQGDHQRKADYHAGHTIWDNAWAACQDGSEYVQWTGRPAISAIFVADHTQPANVPGAQEIMSKKAVRKAAEAEAEVPAEAVVQAGEKR